MSSRERWIIYPLLFFAFLLAARDQFPYLRPQVVKIPRLSCKVIEAQWIGGNIMVAGDLTGDSIQGKTLEADTVRFNDVDAGNLQCERLDAKDQVTGPPSAAEGPATEKPAGNEPDEDPDGAGQVEQD